MAVERFIFADVASREEYLQQKKVVGLGFFLCLGFFNQSVSTVNILTIVLKGWIS